MPYCQYLYKTGSVRNKKPIPNTVGRHPSTAFTELDVFAYYCYMTLLSVIPCAKMFCEICHALIKNLIL